ncbi:MAG: amidohydrolase family protein [Phycisphaerae bacterium]|jgi:cytosine/adenosine deaminase-related metal-dependent hydrolase
MILKGRYVVPVDRPVIEDGAVAVEGGVITGIGRAKEVGGGFDVVDYGDAVIGPGFVNAHTHLELSLLCGRVQASHDFVGWLARVSEHITTELAEEGRRRESVLAGVRASLSAGVTLVGDVTRAPGLTREVLAGSRLRGVSFGEVIAVGRRRGLLSERLEAAASTEWHSERLRVGIAPHAPYSVEPDAMRACAARAAELAAPVCIHLAETPDEALFTRSGEGPFVDLLRRLRVWDKSVPVSGFGPVELARQTGLLTRRTTVAHANYVDDEDIRRLAACGVSVAYCPRTHRAFGHEPHRFRDMMAAGVNVCIGTDSLASNPSLSVLDELRSLRREHPDVEPGELLTMGTLRGARALGFGHDAGSLGVGKRADLVVIPLKRQQSQVEWFSILDSAEPVSAVYVGGERYDPGGPGSGGS